MLSRGGTIITSLTNGSFLGLFLFGFIYTIVGPALPFLIEDFGLSLTQAGFIYSLRGMGMIGAVLLAGVVSDIIGYRKVILAGILLWALGLLIFSFSQSSVLALAIWPIIGFGFGVLDTGLNALVAEVNENKGAALNRLHFWFGAGAFSGPLFAGVILTYFHWRTLFVISAFMVVLYFFQMSRLQYPSSPQQGSSPWVNMRHIWSVWIILLGVLTFGYTGIGTTFMGWINTHLTQSLSLSTWLASTILAIYSIGLSLGRLISSFIAERVQYEKMLVISTLFSLGAAMIAVFSTHPSWVALGFGLTGLFFAAILPMSLAIGAKRFPLLTGTVTGLLITFGSLGRTILPGVVGVVADYQSLSLGLQLMLIVILAMGVSAIALTTFARKYEGVDTTI